MEIQRTYEVSLCIRTGNTYAAVQADSLYNGEFVAALENGALFINLVHPTQGARLFSVPAIRFDTMPNRPVAGVPGRMFVGGGEAYLDIGTEWILLSGIVPYSGADSTLFPLTIVNRMIGMRFDGTQFSNNSGRFTINEINENVPVTV